MVHQVIIDEKNEHDHVLILGFKGSGKTSFIFALAGHLDLSISVLNLSDGSLTDERLAQRLCEVPERSVVLLEDVDAAFIARDKDDDGGSTAYSGSSRLTFSGLLNALDGVTSSESRLLFMTTNYPERLDAALVRPGRVDLKREIGWVTEEQARRMYENFYPERKKHSEDFAEKLELHKVQVSPAVLQGLFLSCENDEEPTEAEIKAFVKQCKADK